jgi:phage shock protein A
MFAQFLLTLIVVAVIAVLLWKAFGKPCVDRYVAATETDLDTLRQRIHELETKKEAIKALEEAIETQTQLSELETELDALHTQLNTELDFLRKKHNEPA